MKGDDSVPVPRAAPVDTLTKALCALPAAETSATRPGVAHALATMRGDTAPTPNVLGRLLALAREIRRPRLYVGYSFFVLLGLTYSCRPILWEGDSSIDVVETFAPWALEACGTACAIHGVVCCLEATSGGQVILVPVSEDHPLHEARHFIAATHIETEPAVAADTIQAFYCKLAIVLLGTVMDGDCGVDVACQMLGRMQNAESRNAIRQDVIN